MDDDAVAAMNDDAVLANASYIYQDDGVEAAQAYLDAHLPDHTIQEEMSDPDSVLIETPKGAVLSIPGTNRPEDLLTDLAVVLGAERNPLLPRHPRFVATEQKYETLLERYGAVKTVGHSLGSTIGQDLARRHGQEHTGFNPGSSPLGEAFALPCGVMDCGARPKIYAVAGDVISTSEQYLGYADFQYVPQSGETAHSLANFLPAHALDEPVGPPKVTMERPKAKVPMQAWRDGFCSAQPYHPLCATRGAPF